MLSRIDVQRTAATLAYRLGDVAAAAAVLRAQEALAQGKFGVMVDWWRIAEAVVGRRLPGKVHQAGPRVLRG